jgi:hypothetical protein
MTQHEHMLRQNLYDIELYARKSLDALERGVDVIPDWIHHKIATARTHMKDTGHFVRYEAHMGRRYSGDKNEMCRGALMNIREYAQAIAKALEKGKQPLPEWAQNKLAVSAEYMDCVGHYLENRGEGRVYSGPAWQTQQFQKEYRGRRIYAQTIEKVFEGRGVAAIGGVRWVPPPAVPGREYSMNRSYEDPRVAQQRELQARRYGVPGYAPGTPGWAGAGGVAQKPHPGPGGCIRGGRNKKGLKRGMGAQHTYGSMGYGSMGDGSMDLATGGERMRRYSMTWKYENTGHEEGHLHCSSCGGIAEEGHRFSGSPPPMKFYCDPPCKSTHTCYPGDICIKTPISAGESGATPSSGPKRIGRRRKRPKHQSRRKRRSARRYGEGEGDVIGRGPSGLAPSGKMKRLWRSRQKSGGSFAGP